MSQFTTTPLMGGGTLVEGTDDTGQSGRTILISERWETVKAVRAHAQANDEFAAVVDEFFKPLTEAAEAAQAIAHPKTEAWNKVTLKEETDYEPAEVIDLDLDGVLLRLLDEGRHDLLRWVGEDVLVAIAQ